jgi:hypothetical protein
MTATRTGKLVVFTVTLLTIANCKVKDPPPITERWSDDFSRDAVGQAYFDTGDHGWHVSDGALGGRGAHNHPLWLRKKLPRDVQIDLDCWSTSAEGDIKVEVFGDGKSYDPNAGRYTATSYVVIFGGWHNTQSKLARQDEHGTEEVHRTAPRVEPDRHYHWTITRKGKVIDWLVDGEPFLHYEDPSPLEGPGHEYFAFNDWESDSWFDNLVITPL